MAISSLQARNNVHIIRLTILPILGKGGGGRPSSGGKNVALSEQKRLFHRGINTHSWLFCGGPARQGFDYLGRHVGYFNTGCCVLQRVVKCLLCSVLASNKRGVVDEKRKGRFFSKHLL